MFAIVYCPRDGEKLFIIDIESEKRIHLACPECNTEYRFSYTKEKVLETIYVLLED